MFIKSSNEISLNGFDIEKSHNLAVKEALYNPFNSKTHTPATQSPFYSDILDMRVVNITEHEDIGIINE